MPVYCSRPVNSPSTRDMLWPRFEYLAGMAVVTGCIDKNTSICIIEELDYCQRCQLKTESGDIEDVCASKSKVVMVCCLLC